MALFETLYTDKRTVTFPRVLPLPTSGSAFLDAGWKASDTNPYSGSLIQGSGSLYDGNLDAAVSPSVETNWSIGAQMHNSGSFTAVSLFDSGTSPGWYNSGSNSSIAVYVSSSNHRWNKCQTFIRPLRDLYSGSIYETHTQLVAPVKGTYIKLHSFDGALKDPSGNNLQFTEMKIYREVDSLLVSGSVDTVYPNINEGDVHSDLTTTEIISPTIRKNTPMAAGGVTV